MKSKKPLVSVIMGSHSDLKHMKPAIDTLLEFKIPHEVQVVSAHRSPHKMREFGMKAQERGIKIIIAGAGGAAHLPGMIASYSLLPVIGVPILSSTLQGIDSLLSVAQMPKGVPVACMAINGSLNAGLMAARMLSVESSSTLKKKLESFQKKQKQIVVQANQKLKLKK